jgi:amino acid adenylation domain-containing protein
MQNNALETLSESQRLIWTASQGANSDAYRVPLVLEVFGKIEPKALVDALHALLQRHEALRLIVEIENGSPHQRLRDANQVTVASYTLSGRELFNSFLTEILAQPMNLEKSCCDAYVVNCQNADGSNLYVILDMHHLICDAWSMQVLANELLALLEGKELSIDPVQFFDWMDWSASRQIEETDCEYWRQSAKNWGSEHDLFSPPQRRIQVDVFTSHIAGAEWSQLGTFAQNNHVSPFEVLVAIWAQVLGRYSKANFLTMTTPWSNRLEEEAHEVVGCLVDNTVLRVPIGSEKSLQILLNEIKAIIRKSLGASELGYERISRILLENQVVPDSNLMIALQPELPKLVGENLVLEVLPTRNFLAKNDLTLRITPLADGANSGAQIELEVRKGLLDGVDQSSLISDFKMFLNNAINQPDTPISQWFPKMTWQGPKRTEIAFEDKITSFDEGRIQEVLEVWRNFLMRPVLGLDSNFFAEGGDSIQALRLVQNLRAAGINCRPRDIFQYPTVRSLLHSLGNAENSAERNPISKDRLLSLEVENYAPPLEAWFFSLKLSNKNHWLQAVCLRLDKALSVQNLSHVLDRIHGEHKIFNRRWKQDPSGNWYAENTDNGENYHLAVGSSVVPEIPDISNGPLSCLAYDPGQKQLTWSIHHLIVDTVSWMVLLEQLSELLLALVPDHSVSPITKEFADRLELDLVSEIAPRLIKIPEENNIDNDLRCHYHSLPGERGTYGQQESLHRVFALSTVDAITSLVGEGFTREEILLSCLVAVMAAHTPERTHLSIVIEHHGRSMDRLGSQKTEIGWHTVMAPITVEALSEDSPTTVLMATMKAMATRRSANFVGIEQGPSICFNYLGNVTATRLDGFEVIPFPEVVLHDPEGVRPFAHEILVWENEEGLHWRWLYGPCVNSTEIEKWLEAIEKHCQLLVESAISQSFVLPAGPLAESLVARQTSTGQRNRYVEQALAFFQGGFDPELIKTTVARLIERHQALRSDFFYDRKDRVIHRVRTGEVKTEYNNLPLRFVDLTNHPENAAEQFEEICRKDASRGFSLDHAPLARFVIGEFGDGNWALALIHHHAVLDGWSLPVLMKEAFQIMDGDVASLPAISAQQPDLARARLLQVSDGVHIDDWRQQFSGVELDGRVNVSTTDAQLNIGDFDLEATLSVILTDRLEAVAASFGVTASSWLLAVFSIARHKMGWSTTTSFGVTIGGRSNIGQDLENFVGLAANTLPFVLPMAGSKTFSEYVKKVHEHSAFLQASGDFRLTDLAKIAGMTPDELVGSLFVFENYPVGELKGQQTNLIDVRMTANAHIPLCLAVIPGDTYSFRLALRGGKIPYSVGQNFIDSLIFLIEQTTYDPHFRLPTLATQKVLPVQQILELSQRKNFLPPAETAFDLLKRSAGRFGDEVALSSDGNEITYAELFLQAKLIAKRLQELLPESGQVVGVMLPRDASLIATFYGISGAGHACLIVDIELPAIRQNAMIESGQPALIIDASDNVATSRHRISFSSLLKQTHVTELFDMGGVPAQSLAYIVFTSGSTGTPKKVAVPIQAIAGLGINQAARMGLKPGHRVMQMASPVFDAFFSELLMCVASGATLCMPDRGLGLTHNDPGAALNRLAITHVTMPPSLLAILPIEDLPKLQVILVAGERATLAQLSPALHAGKLILNAYGPCEATVCATMGSLSAPVVGGVPPNLGHAMDGIDVFVLDRDDMPAREGQAGELAISGSLAWGYLDDPRKTAEVFRPHPWAKVAGERLYFTGDMVVRDKVGNLTFQGRRDRQIKINGHRIELAEVERNIEAIKDVKAVFANLIDVEGQQQLAVWIQAEDELTIDLHSVHTQLANVLPPASIPRNWAIVKDWPRNSSGKIDQTALPAPARISSRVITGDSKEEQTGYPELLALVKRTWVEVIGGQDPNDLDDFLFSGGDSIKAIQLSARLSAVGINVRARDLMTGATPLALAGRGGNQSEEIRPSRNRSELAPIQRMLIERLGTLPERWLLSAELELDTTHNLSEIVDIISRVFERHPALSLTLSRDGVLQILPPVGKVVPVFKNDSDQEPNEFFDSLAEEIDPFTGPCFVAGLSEVSGRTVLMLCGHHFFIDIVSLRLLYDEINQALGNRFLAVPAPSYLEWSHQVIEDTKLGLFNGERDYWIEKLSTVSALEKLFVGDRPKEGQTTRITRHLDVAKADLSSNDLEAILLQAHADIMCSPDAADLIVECERHGRSYPINFPSELVVGWLTASFPVRVRSGNSPNVVADQIANAPSGGTGFLALLYSSDASGELLKDAFNKRCLMSFNFLGELPAEQKGSGSVGKRALVLPETGRLQHLSVEAWKKGDKLFVRWCFDPTSWRNAEEVISSVLARAEQLIQVGLKKQSNFEAQIPEQELQALINILQDRSDG